MCASQCVEPMTQGLWQLRSKIENARMASLGLALRLKQAISGFSCRLRIMRNGP